MWLRKFNLLKEIRKIIELYDQTDHKNEKLALASVINVEESSYRRIGARMLVSSTGIWVGGISGGCLEGDALKRSQKAIYNSTSSIVVYDTMDDDDRQIGVGLGCNGIIEVLFTPINSLDPNNEIELLKSIAKDENPSILLKVVESDNESYLGSCITADIAIDNLDFCELEYKVLQEKILDTRLKRRPQIIEVANKQNEDLRLLVEYIRPETKIVIVGDNYDVNAMVSIISELGWDIYLVGRKKKFSKIMFSKAKKLYEYEEADNVPICDYTAVVLMSHDYNWDKSILPLVLKKKPAYVGMLGPKKRMQKMLLEESLSELDKIEYFYSPVGLDIGAESPEEIAISIVSEIVAAMRNRKGSFLKNRKGSIHERI